MAYCPQQKEKSFLIGLIKNGWPLILAAVVAAYAIINVAAYVAIATGASGHINPILHAPLYWLFGR